MPGKGAEQFVCDIAKPEPGSAGRRLCHDHNAGPYRELSQVQSEALPQKSLNTIADHRMPDLPGYGGPQADPLVAVGWRCNKKKEMSGMQPCSSCVALGILGCGTYQTFLRQREAALVVCAGARSRTAVFELRHSEICGPWRGGGQALHDRSWWPCGHGSHECGRGAPCSADMFFSSEILLRAE